MEAALFTLDIIMVILLMVAVRRADNDPDKAGRNLGLFAYLENKGDKVQKGFTRRKGRGNA
jgi:hypothetical protein